MNILQEFFREGLTITRLEAKTVSRWTPPAALRKARAIWEGGAGGGGG